MKQTLTFLSPLSSHDLVTDFLEIAVKFCSADPSNQQEVIDTEFAEKKSEMW